MKRLTVERETSEGETFREFRGFGAIRESFLREIWGRGVLWCGKSEHFLPRKFPAIRYHTYQSVWEAVGDKPCQGNKLLNYKFKDPYAVTVTKGKLIVGCFPKKNFAFCSVLVDKTGQFSVFGHAARRQCAQISLTYRKQIFEGRNFCDLGVQRRKFLPRKNLRYMILLQCKYTLTVTVVCSSKNFTHLNI